MLACRLRLLINDLLRAESKSPADTDAILSAAHLQPLDAISVAGVSLQNVSLLRLDRCGGGAAGNKWFKLQGYLAAQRDSSLPLLSFGGAWSNHLHALAAVGHDLAIPTIGLVRGPLPKPLTPTLQDAKDWGMQLYGLSYSEYRQRNTVEFQQQIQQRFGPCELIPEGGAGPTGAAGCVVIGRHIGKLISPPATLVMAVGTGTTLAGVAAGLPSGFEVVGVSALKAATDMERRIEQSLQALPCPSVPWSIWHEAHEGGFARCSDRLREFINEFEARSAIELDPIYSGKALYAVYRHWCCMRRPDQPQKIVVIHSGGLQGRRGFSWLRA